MQKSRPATRYNVVQQCDKLKAEAFRLIDQSPASQEHKDRIKEVLGPSLMTIPDLYPVQKEVTFQNMFRQRWLEAREQKDYDHEAWLKVAAELGMGGEQ